MKRSIVLVILSCSLFLVESKTGQEDENQRSLRIIDGRPAAAGQFPWQVGINFNNQSGNYICGGSLINHKWVLTSAQCVKGASMFILHFGGVTLSAKEPHKVVIATSEYKRHPTLDVALIHLRIPLKFTDRIKPITLPPENYKVQIEDSFTVSGWGQIDFNHQTGGKLLHFADLTATSEQKCKELYGNAVNDYLFCAKGNLRHNVCAGDIGGPLIAYNEGVELLVGVASLIHESGCTASMPSGYILVPVLTNWIQNVTKNTCNCKCSHK